MRRLLLAAGLVALVAGCGKSESDIAPATATTATTEAPTEPATETATTPEAAPRVATSGGITVRLLRVRTAKTVSYKGGTQDSSVTPDAKPRTIHAPQGGRYVY